MLLSTLKFLVRLKWDCIYESILLNGNSMNVQGGEAFAKRKFWNSLVAVFSVAKKLPMKQFRSWMQMLLFKYGRSWKRYILISLWLRKGSCRCYYHHCHDHYSQIIGGKTRNKILCKRECVCVSSVWVFMWCLAHTKQLINGVIIAATIVILFLSEWASFSIYYSKIITRLEKIPLISRDQAAWRGGLRFNSALRFIY